MPSIPTPRQKRKRFTATIALIVLLAVPEFLVIFLQRVVHDSPLHQGDTIPLLTLRGLDSDSLSFSDLSGRKMVLFFFSVGCERCRRELSSIERLGWLFKDSLVLVAISLSDSCRTRAAMRQEKLGVITLVDDLGEARRAFGIEEVPALILVDGDQTVRQLYFGEKPFEVLRNRLNEFAGGGYRSGNGQPQEQN